MCSDKLRNNGNYLPTFNIWVISHTDLDFWFLLTPTYHYCHGTVIVWSSVGHPCWQLAGDLQVAEGSAWRLCSFLLPARCLLSFPSTRLWSLERKGKHSLFYSSFIPHDVACKVGVLIYSWGNWDSDSQATCPRSHRTRIQVSQPRVWLYPHPSCLFQYHTPEIVGEAIIPILSPNIQ